jgi:hypothetical protein
MGVVPRRCGLVRCGHPLEVAMSEPVIHLLDLFDALPEPDQRFAVAEILRRRPAGEADVSATGLDALAGELFAALDAAETARATTD